MLLSFHKRRRLFPIITTAIKLDKRQRSHVCSFRHFNQPCETRPIIPQQSLPDPQSQAEPMSASFRGMQAPSKCLKTVDQTITQDFFNYTSGRWIYNERQQLDARRIDFSVPALKQAASAVMGMSECIEMIKLPKGLFNRAFLLTFDNGTEAVARLPTSLAGPPRLTTASEVATLKTHGRLGYPCPKGVRLFVHCGERSRR
jgi:hypothetical protein